MATNNLSVQDKYALARTKIKEVFELMNSEDVKSDINRNNSDPDWHEFLIYKIEGAKEIIDSL